MANVKTTGTEPVEVPATSSGNSFWKREFNGATFLSLEHAAHMALVVVIAFMFSVGTVMAISLWTGNSGVLTALGTWPTIGGPAASWSEANAAVSVVATLAVLVPLFVVLDRRTRAEWAKRPGYASRLAYKLPLYIALGAVIVAKVCAVIHMLTVVLTSLAVVGVKGSGVGEMYLYQFLPAAIAAVIFTGAGWYLFRLAKGIDIGRSYSIATALCSIILAVALFVTAVIVLQTPSTTNTMPESRDYFQDFDAGGSRSLEDLFKY